MFRKTNAFFAYLSAHVSLIVLVFGTSLFAAAWGWAASTTAHISALGPIAWVGGASFGAALFILLALGYAFARQRIVRTTIERRFFQDAPDRVNPLDERHRHRRIKLADLASPIDALIAEKTFEDCELLGPATVAVEVTGPGGGSMVECNFYNACGILVREGAPAMNCIVMRDCHLRRCRVNQITFLFAEGAYERLSKEMPGLIWLTRTPGSPS